MRSAFTRLTSPRSESSAAGILLVLAVLVAWLWPIGIGGKMPVGGDVTQFFLGLMGFLGESLRAGRLPVWNDLWGYGFPGLAESQMGVFYPVHLVLYRWLDTETAYVASLVLHTLWGGMGTFWAARRLSISPAGSALAAISWSTCGFFLVHLAHQWGYTTGCWMPWAWGLTWCCLAPAGAFRAAAPFLLSLVLVLQVLPGHFQLAFMTQVGVFLILLWAAIERLSARFWGAIPSSANAEFTLRGAWGVTLALAGAFPLAAIQVWPTARLARLAASQRDFEYLSGFASTPFHMVNYVAPGLFHRSPLWRPLVWDPFHAMPEEHMAYVGLVPLFLACVTMIRQGRRDGKVRALTVLVVVSVLLSLGPYVPGFRYLIMVPGFSFFRAAARWSLATGLALALLAGKGFDCWRDWPRPARSMERFGFVAIFWAVATVGLIELALSSHSRQTLARSFQRVFDAMPWRGDPSFASVMAGARGLADDPRIPAGLNRSVFLQKSGNGQSFAGERWRIYTIELAETAGLLVALGLIARLSQKGRLSLDTARRLLFLVTIVDLCALGQHRLLDVGPLRPLIEQSPVLARLGREPRGTRLASDRFKNMPMLVGLAPIAAYRTLDLPAAPELTSLTQGPLAEPLVQAALRASGTGVRVFDPIENRKDHVLGRKASPRETLEDRVLASWLFGRAWVDEQAPWARTFTLWHADTTPVRAWLVPQRKITEPAILKYWSGDPREALTLLNAGRPLETEMSRPETWNISVNGDEPGWVIVSQLADPQWTAWWIGLDGQGERGGELLPVFQKESQPGGWQRIPVPASGRWTLRLEYEARDVAEGAAISGVAWLCWVLAALFTVFRTWRDRTVSDQDQTEA